MMIYKTLHFVGMFLDVNKVQPVNTASEGLDRDDGSNKTAQCITIGEVLIPYPSLCSLFHSDKFYVLPPNGF